MIPWLVFIYVVGVLFGVIAIYDIAPSPISACIRSIIWPLLFVFVGLCGVLLLVFKLFQYCLVNTFPEVQ